MRHASSAASSARSIDGGAASSAASTVTKHDAAPGASESVTVRSYHSLRAISARAWLGPARPGLGSVGLGARVDIDGMHGALEVLAGALERSLGDLPVAGEHIIEIANQVQDVRDGASERGGHQRVQ